MQGATPAPFSGHDATDLKSPGGPAPASADDGDDLHAGAGRARLARHLRDWGNGAPEDADAFADVSSVEEVDTESREKSQ
jgi:hypothetical protein